MSKVTIDNLDLDTSSMALTVKRDEGKPKVTKLDAIYEAHAKLVFLFDCSSSMSERLSQNYVEMFLWSKPIFEAVAKKAEEVFASDPAGTFIFGSAAVLWRMVDPQTGKFHMEEDEVKRQLVQHDLTGLFNVPVDWAKHKETTPSRSDVVRRIARKEIERRLDKFPDSNIAVVFFNQNPSLEFNNGTREQLFTALDRIYAAGGTDILEAIKKGLRACEDSPSSVGLHHFVMVSDGEDNRASQVIADWVPSLKASGVVLDYIHIGDRSVNEGLVNACKALGGDCVTVNTVADLESKFMEATARKCLPSA